jgi:hypothetical protein
MNKELFKSKYVAFKKSDTEIDQYIETITNFENFIRKEIEETTIVDIKSYVKYLIDHNINKYNNFIHIARYYYYINYKEHYIHMTKYFNTHGVLESIINRIDLYASSDDKKSIIDEMNVPSFGTDNEELPKYTKELMEVLNKHLSKDQCDKILAGNNHQIPKESMLKEKDEYLKSPTLKDYLKERHARKVEELQQHLDENKVWFEQIITKEAVDFVRSNQEVLSGVIEDDKLYITKIPYDLANYLNEDDDTLKRYYACHCSFVRESIKKDDLDIQKQWCYCSAGFAKFPFEVILDQELDIKLLKTPLDGDDVCRFEIDLSNINYKK